MGGSPEDQSKIQILGCQISRAFRAGQDWFLSTAKGFHGSRSAGKSVQEIGISCGFHRGILWDFDGNCMGCLWDLMVIQGDFMMIEWDLAVGEAQL